MFHYFFDLILSNMTISVIENIVKVMETLSKKGGQPFLLRNDANPFFDDLKNSLRFSFGVIRASNCDICVKK